MEYWLGCGVCDWHDSGRLYGLAGRFILGTLLVGEAGADHRGSGHNMYHLDNVGRVARRISIGARFEIGRDRRFR